VILLLPSIMTGRRSKINWYPQLWNY